MSDTPETPDPNLPPVPPQPSVPVDREATPVPPKTVNPPRATPGPPSPTGPPVANEPPKPSLPSKHEGTSVPVTPGTQSPYSPPRPKRTSEEIRRDIEAQRTQLGQNVDHLRDKVTELTDWRSQLKKHRKQIVIGAVATGFVVGGMMALRRR